MDETTFSLGSESKKLVHEASEILLKVGTSIIIAHRHSTTCSDDHILVLDKVVVT